MKDKGRVLKDITLKITGDMLKDKDGNQKRDLIGHLGTHFDVMDKEFPLEYLKRKAVIFDVRGIQDRDIEISDIDMDLVQEDMFVGFCSDLIMSEGYGTEKYSHGHPELSMELIEALAEKKISIIGIDFAGVRRGKQHTPADQYCADRGVFIVENLCDLSGLIGKKDVVINTYPMNCEGVSGLPCRVIAEYEDDTCVLSDQGTVLDRFVCEGETGIWNISK